MLIMPKWKIPIVLLGEQRLVHFFIEDMWPEKRRAWSSEAGFS
jgi:hypothetical protein